MEQPEYTKLMQQWDEEDRHREQGYQEGWEAACKEMMAILQAKYQTARR